MATPPAVAPDAARAPCDGEGGRRGRLGGGDRGGTSGRPGVELVEGQGGPGARTSSRNAAGVGRPVVGVARGGDGDELVELGREPGDPARGGRHPAVHVLVGDVDGGVAGERLGAGEHLEEHQPGGVDVAAGVGDAALDLLGGEVGDGAQQHARVLVTVWLVTARARPKSATLTVPLSLMMTFSGLTSRWMRPLAWASASACEHRLEHVEGGPGREQPLVAQHVAQGLAGHVLHREEDAARRPRPGRRRRRRWGATASAPSGPRGGSG